MRFVNGLASVLKAPDSGDSVLEPAVLEYITLHLYFVSCCKYGTVYVGVLVGLKVLGTLISSHEELESPAGSAGMLVSDEYHTSVPEFVVLASELLAAAT